MTVGAVSRIAGTLGAVLFALANLGAAPRPWPLYMSLSRDKVFLREGPTYQHKVLWIYTRKDLPVQIIAKYDVWRRVKDSEGTVGWVHATMVSARRTVLVIAKHPAAIRADADPDSKIEALAQPGVVAKLEACEADACEISAAGTDGWIEKKDIWGVNAGEVFK